MSIIFEGDYIRDTDGVISKVIEFSNYDQNGDADCILENGRVINSAEVAMDDVFLESEVI